jgi:N-acetyl-gamma-glutamyl-phosphate reductase
VEVTVAVLGASGYAGQEVVRLLAGHPHARIVLLAARQRQGGRIHDLYPGLPPIPGHDGSLQALEPLPDLRGVDAVFCALPHGASAPVVIAALEAGCRVFDLGADFRLRDPALYPQWYGFPLPAPELLAEAVYGLPEWLALQARQRGTSSHALVEARLVAVPGCYPTGALLGLLPPLLHGLIDPDSIVVDSKSGASGAGRSPGDAFTFSELTENVRAYGVTSHRHTPEIEQELARAAGRPVQVSFTPHLVPMARGILTTAYARLAPGVGEEQVERAYREAYHGLPFLRRAPAGRQPETKWTRGSNLAFYQWVVDRRTQRLVVTTAIDNLGKGAAGQAVQCFNLAFGLAETAGLVPGGVSP